MIVCDLKEYFHEPYHTLAELDCGLTMQVMWRLYNFARDVILVTVTAEKVCLWYTFQCSLCHTSKPFWMWGRKSMAFVLSSVSYTKPVLSSTASLLQSYPYLSSHYSFFVETFCFCQGYSSWSLLTHIEINHEGKDDRLAQHTDSKFLLLSSFRWCFGNIPISSICSKDWSEE